MYCLKWRAILLSLLILLPLNQSYADERVHVKVGYQLLIPSGTIAGVVNGIGQTVDIERDLSLDDSENVTTEIALLWSNSQLTFNYLPIEFSGTGTLTVSGTFNRQPFSINDTVSSKFSIDLYDLGYTYYFINMDDLPTRFQLGLEVAVKVADTDIIFNNQTQGYVEKESATVPIPTIGARTRIALGDFLGLTGRIGYMEFEENRLLDAEAQLEYSPLPNVGIYAGYRVFDLKIGEDDLYASTDFSGPFAGVLIRF